MCRKVKMWSLEKKIQREAFQNIWNGNVWAVVWRFWRSFFFFLFWIFFSNCMLYFQMFQYQIQIVPTLLFNQFSTLQLWESNTHLVKTMLWIFTFSGLLISSMILSHDARFSSEPQLPVSHMIMRVNNLYT